MMHFLAGIFHADLIQDWKSVEWIRGFAIFLDRIFLPTLIITAVIGILWVVSIGFKMTSIRDEESYKQQKKHLIHVAVGIIVFMLFIFLITFLSVKLPSFIEG